MFETWYTSREWFKDNKSQWKNKWETLEDSGWHSDDIEYFLDGIISLVANEYGE